MNNIDYNNDGKLFIIDGKCDGRLDINNAV